MPQTLPMTRAASVTHTQSPDDGFDGPFGLAPELTAEDLVAEGCTSANPALQAEVNALVAQAEPQALTPTRFSKTLRGNMQTLPKTNATPQPAKPLRQPSPEAIKMAAGLLLRLHQRRQEASQNRG